MGNFMHHAFLVVTVKNG